MNKKEVIDLIKDYKQNGSNINAGLRDEYKAEVEQLRITFMTQIDQVNAQIKELEGLLKDGALIVLPGTHYCYLENLRQVGNILDNFL